MKKIRILLADLKSYYLSSPYQLGLLAAYARLEEEVMKNVEFTFTEHAREEPVEEVANAIISAEADLVAASNYCWNYKKLVRLLDLLTESGAKLPRIVLGGPNSEGEFGADLMKRYPIISAMVQAEGEPAFRDICSALVDSPTKDPFIHSRNCVLRTDDGQVIRPDMNHRIEYLEEVPSPYLTGLISPKVSPVFYETNRGCPYRCSFCYWGNGNSKVYRMSHERIREEMEFFAKNKVSYFWIADANFGIFPDDAEIAEMMAEINSRHGYPFKVVGINWAKNSSDRVLEIASTLRKGGMRSTTTLAVQSVTPEAESISRRYSMAPSKFINLISAAHESDIDTYTDLIWGLPGEDYGQYVDGIEAVISTGVPAIMIHQLFLLPGTEFFEKREELGITMLSQVGGSKVESSLRSDYWDYIVVSHPKMSEKDMKRGARIMCINHFLHNHDLGKAVDFYLARYGVSHRQVYEFLDAVLLGKVKALTGARNGLLNDLRTHILNFSESTGLEELTVFVELARVVWYENMAEEERPYAKPALRTFMHDFYAAFCREHEICKEPEEKAVLSEFIDYNLLISPKPAWRPNSHYSFEYDIHAIWRDMLERILATNGSANGATPGTIDGKGSEVGDNGTSFVEITSKKKETWTNISADLRSRLSKLLTNEYIDSRRGPVAYKVENPWQFLPHKKSAEWAPSNYSKHCIISYENNFVNRSES